MDIMLNVLAGTGIVLVTLIAYGVGYTRGIGIAIKLIDSYDGIGQKEKS